MPMDKSLYPDNWAAIAHLDLFSGIGGFAIAAHQLGIHTQQFVEINPFCQQVLANHFSGIPCHEDITTFSPSRDFDLITAGFPCQDISHANPNGKGLIGERSGLFFEIIRLVRDIRPRYVVLENSAALLHSSGGRDLGTILWELAQCGFDAEWSVLSACSVGAPHLRKRLFIVAHSHRLDEPRRLAFHRKQRQPLQAIHKEPCPGLWSRPIPSPPGISDGIPRRVDRLRALGNAVVPDVALVALRRVIAMEGVRYANG